MILRAFYVGALPLMLAAGALTRPSARRVGLAAAGLGALAVVVGFEPFLSIASALPGPVRTDKSTFLFVFAAALLAGRGLDDLVAARPPLLPRAALVVMSVTLAAFPLVYMLAVNTSSFAHLDAALTLAWGFHVPLEATTAVTHDEVVRLAALLEWLPFAAAGAALLALRRTRKVTIVAFAVLALTVTAVDLFKLSMGYNTAVTFAQDPHPQSPAIQYLRRGGYDRFVSVDPGGFATLDRGASSPDLSMRYGTYTAERPRLPCSRPLHGIVVAHHCTGPFRPSLRAAAAQ